jgi:D-serine deaminase-like pyridoxal phosphate-dependent protein
LISQLLPAGLRTPATLVFLERLDRNLAEMAAFAGAAGVRLRPHAKTHKCLEIARRQMALGAGGITVATVGEAEILTTPSPAAAAGGPDVTDVFIAYPLWVAEDVVPRLRTISDRARVTIGADSSAAMKRLAPLAGQVAIMIEVDCGLARTGVPPASAASVAEEADRAGLEVAGVFTFPGHSYRPGAAPAAAADEAAALATAAATLVASGFEVRERSGGSTPSARLIPPGTLTELRPGVYVFNDAQQVELDVVEMADVALMVAATVVSRPAPARFVLDAGSKVLGPDRATWATGYGRLPDWPEARIVGLWEHHAVVVLDGRGPDLGEVVAVVPNHVCTAVNLVTELLVVEGREIVERWPVAARAANR